MEQPGGINQENPFAPFIESVGKAVDSIVAYGTQVLQQVMPAIQGIMNALNERYQEAGAPYGDTQEGMLHWMKDMAEISHKQQEIERILQYHEMLVSARKIGEQIRARQQEQAIDEIAQMSQDLGLYD